MSTLLFNQCPLSRTQRTNHIVPLRRFIEAAYARDLRHYSSESCFKVIITCLITISLSLSLSALRIIIKEPLFSMQFFFQHGHHLPEGCRLYKEGETTYRTRYILQIHSLSFLFLEQVKAFQFLTSLKMEWKAKQQQVWSRDSFRARTILLYFLYTNPPQVITNASFSTIKY